MSFGISKKDREEYKHAQREQERRRQENIRKSLERNSFKSILAAENAKDAAAAEAQQRKLKALEDEQKTLLIQMRNESIWLLTDPDPQHATDPDAPSAFYGDASTGKTGIQQAYEYSTDQFLKFQAETPEYLAYQENADALDRYLQVNGSNTIVSAKQFKQAFTRLLEAGLMVTGAPVEKTAPAPEPWTNIEEYDFSTGKPGDIIAGWNWNNPTERCSLTRKQLDDLLNADERAYKLFCRDAMRTKPAPKKDDGEWGYERGKKVWKSAWEVTQMGSDEYRRFAKPRTNIDQLLVQPDLVSDL
jgi:hypothetical protein